MGLGISINKSVWQQIVNVLKIPPYSETKRFGLNTENSLPLIFGKCVFPLIESFQLLLQPKPSDAKRFYFDLCLQCFEENISFLERTDLNICNYCGSTSQPSIKWDYLRNSRKLLQCRRYNPGFYKRLSHFKQWLYRLQGKEKNNVTSDVLHTIRVFLFNENTINISFWTIKNALRRLKLQIYYKNACFIMKEIRGHAVFDMSKHQEDKLIYMFLSMADVYTNVLHTQVPIRVNMLSYPYIIRKLCEICKWYRVARVIPFLKSHSSIINQDQIWCLICSQMNWPFIPTKPWLDIDHRSADRKPQ